MPPRNAASLISLYVHGFDSWQARTRLRNLDVWAEAVAERANEPSPILLEHDATL